MSEEDFINEIQELKDKMMVVANRHSNVTKFEINIDYSWENRNTIVDWKDTNPDKSLEKYNKDPEADKGVIPKDWDEVEKLSKKPVKEIIDNYEKVKDNSIKQLLDKDYSQKGSVK